MSPSPPPPPFGFEAPHDQRVAGAFEGLRVTFHPKSPSVTTITEEKVDHSIH